MRSRSWLDMADSGPRRVLIGLTAASLVVGTVLLEQMHLTLVQMDGIAAVWLGGLALLWGLLRWRTEPRVRAMRIGDTARRERDLHHRGILVGGAVDDRKGGLEGLAAIDPGFSEPALVDRMRRLLLAHQTEDPRAAAWIRTDLSAIENFQILDLRCVSVAHSTSTTACILAAHVHSADGDASLRLTCERPPGAASRSPDQLATLDAPPNVDDWHITGCLSGPEEALSIPPPDPSLEADLRALRGRDEAFDPKQVAERTTRLIATLAEGDHAAARAMCVAGTTDAVFSGLPELAASSNAPTWLSAGFDGWFDLAELRCGAVLFAFLRPTGARDAPWLLWRAQRGTLP